MSTPPTIARRDEYTIRSYEVDTQGNATLPLLCRLMQESASNHAEQLGLGISWLTEHNLAWVLTRQRVVMDTYPRWGETIRVLTWPTGRDRLLWYRDFKLLDSKENVIGRATTAWLVIDAIKRRPQRTDMLPSLDISDDVERAFTQKPGKVAALDERTAGHAIHVGYPDLDVNAHVNNTRYIEWVLNAFELDFLKSHGLKEVEANYLIEALYGDALTTYCQAAGEQAFLHSVMRNADGLELFRARTLWESMQ